MSFAKSKSSKKGYGKPDPRDSIGGSGGGSLGGDQPEVRACQWQNWRQWLQRYTTSA